VLFRTAHKQRDAAEAAPPNTSGKQYSRAGDPRAETLVTGQSFREVKRAITGEDRVFDCTAISVSARLAIVRFDFTRPLTVDGRTYEAGGWTEGFFWRARRYNLYHIRSRQGEVIADRFDVIERVRIHPGGVRYHDLLLDVWLYPDGRVFVEDEDELEEAIALGRVSPWRQAIVARTRRLLLSRGRRIVDGALASLAAVEREQSSPAGPA